MTNEPWPCLARWPNWRAKDGSPAVPQGPDFTPEQAERLAVAMSRWQSAGGRDGNKLLARVLAELQRRAGDERDADLIEALNTPRPTPKHFPKRKHLAACERILERVAAIRGCDPNVT